MQRRTRSSDFGNRLDHGRGHPIARLVIALWSMGGLIGSGGAALAAQGAPAKAGSPAPSAQPGKPDLPPGSNPKLESAENDAKGPIMVSAAASLRDVLTEIAARYEESHLEAKVTLNFGASNVLARQIVELAPVDLFFSADSVSMDAVEKADRVEPGTRRDLLSNSLVVIVPSDSTSSIQSLEDLTSEKVRRIALCDAAVPIGRYSRTWLESKGKLNGLTQKIVRPDDARATLAMVESGAVDAGFVYKTDARVAKGARVAFEIPVLETPGIVYPAAVMRNGHNPAGGRDFLFFVSNPPGVYLFSGAGFTVLAPPHRKPATTPGSP